MTERRRPPRNLTYLGASITYNKRYSTFDCTVVNLTDEGAMLTTSGTSSIPEVFDLFVTHKFAKLCRQVYLS